MLNKNTACIVNVTSNMMYGILENKNDHYKFLHYIIPQHKFKRINYIKKVKQEAKDELNITSKMAKKLEISKREINLYKQQLNIE